MKIMKKSIIFILIITMFVSGLFIPMKQQVYAKDVDVFWVTRDMVYYSAYDSKVKSKVESLMDDVDKLQKSYSAKLSKQILEDFVDTIKKVPSNQMFYLYPDAVNFNNHNYDVEKSNPGTLQGYDQFSYVMYNYIATNFINLSGDAREEFFVDLTNILYQVCIDTYNNGDKELFAESYLSYLNEIGDRFSDYTQRVIEAAMNMAEYYATENDKELPGKGKTPSEYIDSQDKEAQDDMNKALEEHKKQNEVLDDINFANSQKDAYNDIYEKDDDYEVPNVKYTDSSSRYEQIQQEYNNGVSEVSKTSEDDDIYTIYYTLNKKDKDAKYEDTRIEVTNDKVDFRSLKSALKKITSEDKDTFLLEDVDMTMFIAEGKVLVMNQLAGTIKNDEINSLFDIFDNIGLKVAIKSNKDLDEDNSLQSMIEAGKINAIQINKDKLILNNKPILKNGIVQLPVKTIVEAMGLEFKEEKDSYVIKNDNTTLTLKVNDKKYNINEKESGFKTTPQLINNVLYAEFDSIAKTFGFTYYYDADAQVFIFK